MDLTGFNDPLTGLAEKISGYDVIGIIPISKYSWLLPTIIGRLTEEFGIRNYLILTSPHVESGVEDSLSYVRSLNLNIMIDKHFGLGNMLSDNVFDTSFKLLRLFDKIAGRDKPSKIIIDLTGCEGPLTLAVTYSAEKKLNDRIIYTVMDSIPLYGIPAYPGSPRWLHRIYVFGEPSINGEGVQPVKLDYPRNIEWRGSRGIYIAMSRVFNSVTMKGCYEKLVDERRSLLEEGPRIEAWIGSLGAIEERKKLYMIDELKGPDENTAKQIYIAWKGIVELLSEQIQDRQTLERMIMQIQRYVGAADLVIRDIVSTNQQISNYIGEKLHRVLLSLPSEKSWIAVVPDTNLFYQGFHMTLLKSSIRMGQPWSPIRGLTIYVPRCAEAEINGKVAETNPDSGLQYRISYTLALLANRALLETKYYYDAKSLSATAQPCEAAIAVEAPNLPESRIILLTADHKAFTAWQTLNVCRGKVSCIYIGHSDQPLTTDSIYGKFYTSIAVSLLTYVSSLFVPVTIKASGGNLRLIVKGLKGSNAPVITIHRFEERR